MKIRQAAVAIAVVIATAAMLAVNTHAQDGAEVPTYQVDPMHSSVVFRIKHMDISYVYGMFEKLEGQLQVTDNDVPTSVTLTIDTASVNTGVEPRDNHLRNPDFFHGEEHPTIVFKSTSIASSEADDGMGAYTVTGELTLLGQTRTITAGLDFTGSGEMRGQQRVGVEAAFTIKRSDFGMTHGIDKGSLSDEVTLMVALQGFKK